MEGSFAGGGDPQSVAATHKLGSPNGADLMSEVPQRQRQSDTPEIAEGPEAESCTGLKLSIETRPNPLLMTRQSFAMIAQGLVSAPGFLWREAMYSDQPSRAESPPKAVDEIDEGALASVMRTVPLGAAVLAGSAVALLVLGYLIVYIFVFLPRGTVG